MSGKCWTTKSERKSSLLVRDVHKPHKCCAHLCKISRLQLNMRKTCVVVGPFVVTDHRAAVAQKEWKTLVNNVHKADKYSPKHRNLEANVKRYNKMFGS